MIPLGAPRLFTRRPRSEMGAMRPVLQLDSTLTTVNLEASSPARVRYFHASHTRGTCIGNDRGIKKARVERRTGPGAVSPRLWLPVRGDEGGLRSRPQNDTPRRTPPSLV